MSGIAVDLGNELDAIRREAMLLTIALRLVATDVSGTSTPLGCDGYSPEAARLWLDAQGIASGIEKIYSGCERVMAKIAAAIDGAPVSRSDGWHVALLRRMANPFPAVRDRVISAEVYASLDRFRAFRHRERSSYGIDLNAQIVIERGEEVVAMFTSFDAEIRSFLESREERPAPMP